METKKAKITRKSKRKKYTKKKIKKKRLVPIVYITFLSIVLCYMIYLFVYKKSYLILPSPPTHMYKITEKAYGRSFDRAESAFDLGLYDLSFFNYKKYLDSPIRYPSEETQTKRALAKNRMLASYLLTTSSPEVAKYIPKIKVSKEENIMQQARRKYSYRNYKGCLDLLETICTDDENILEEVSYYYIMARYHIFEIPARRHSKIPVKDINDLEIDFKKFIEESQGSKRFDAVEYHLGHFYLMVCHDSEAALKVFDNIVEDHFDSDWIQGSLYYSAILHYEKNTTEDRKIAIRRLRILSKVGGKLRIIETGKDDSATRRAKKLLDSWSEDNNQEKNDDLGSDSNSMS